MTRKKKTRLGAEVRSVPSRIHEPKPIWWLAVIEKEHLQVFEYVWPMKTLSTVFETTPTTLREETSRRLRDSAGRSFDSFSWSKGGHGVGSPRHAYSSRLLPREKASLKLFKDGVDFLKQASKEGRFDFLALFSHPQSRGTFKKLLNPRLIRKVKIEENTPALYVTPRKLQRALISQIPVGAEEPPRWFPKPRGTHLMKRFEPLERRET